MVFLLDTNAISGLMREDPRMIAWLSLLKPEDRVVTCTVALGEILFGLERLEPGARRCDLESKARRVLAAIPCEPVPEAAAEHYAAVKTVQQRRGLPLDENDLWVAATALAIDATLVSADSDFQRIAKLRLAGP